MAAAGEPGQHDPLEVAAALNRYANMLRELEKATAASDPEVMVTAQDRNASMLQSWVAAHATETEALPAGGEEVKFGTGLEDPLGWALSLLKWVDRDDAHAIVRPPTTDPHPLPETCRVALVADWGTGLYGAPVSADSIADTGPWDLLMHLGDVYYSGTKDETRDRFLGKWPDHAAAVNRAINGNHEMYSGGFGYFDLTLPAFGQAASSFAFANEHWLLIGLDTAYVDHAMDGTQVAWVRAVVDAHGDGRKLVLFSHQQPFSRLDKQGPKLLAALDWLLSGRRITAWYWGHEHDCVIYDPHPLFGLLGRCLGNGGIPAFRRENVRSAPAKEECAGIAWRSLGSTGASPACVVLDGPNPYITGKEDKFVPHGYVTLELDGATLTERFHLADGTAIHEQEIA